MTFPDTCREDDVIDTEAGEVTVVIANGPATLSTRQGARQISASLKTTAARADHDPRRRGL